MVRGPACGAVFVEAGAGLQLALVVGLQLGGLGLQPGSPLLLLLSCSLVGCGLGCGVFWGAGNIGLRSRPARLLGVFQILDEGGLLLHLAVDILRANSPLREAIDQSGNLIDLVHEFSDFGLIKGVRGGHLPASHRTGLNLCLSGCVGIQKRASHILKALEAQKYSEIYSRLLHREYYNLCRLI